MALTLVFKLMDWIKEVQDSANEHLGKLIGLAIAMLITFFKKLPGYIIEKVSEYRNIKALSAGSAINDAIANVTEDSNAVYNVINLYHNGGGNLEKNTKIHLTIKWERIRNNLCSGCMTTDCVLKQRIPRIKDDFQQDEINDEWRQFVNKTVHLKGEINSSTTDKIGPLTKQVWAKYGVFKYNEVILKHKSYGFYTLGMGYCHRFKDTTVPYGIIQRAVNRLKKLL